MKSPESTLLDFISSPILQYVQNSYAQKHQIAMVFLDRHGKAVTPVTLPEWLQKADQPLQIFVDSQLRAVPDPVQRGLSEGRVAYDSYFQGLWYRVLMPLAFNREYLGTCQFGFSIDTSTSAWRAHALAFQDFMYESNSHLYFLDQKLQPPGKSLLLLTAGLQSQLQRLLDAGWQRRHARTAVMAEQRQNRNAEGNGATSGLITTRSFDIIEADSSVVLLLQYDQADEMVGLNFFNHLVFQKNKGVELLEFIEQEIPVAQYDLALARKDGTPCRVSLSVLPQKSFHDEPVGYQFVFATQKDGPVAPPPTKKVETGPAGKPPAPDSDTVRNRLADLYTRMAQQASPGDPLLQQVAQPLFVLDHHNRVLLWNQAMETLLHIPAAAILQNRFDQLLLDSSRTLWYGWISELRLDPAGEEFKPEEPLGMVDNRGRVVQSHVQLYKDAVQGHELIAVLFTDPVLVSEFSATAEAKPPSAQEYFVRSLSDAPVYRPGTQVQELRTLVATLTRQIEGSLENVSSPVESLLWSEPSGKKFRTSVSRFHHDLENTMMMIRRLQYFAQIFDYRPQLVPLHRLIRQAVGLQTRLFANPVQLYLDLSPEVGLIMGDVSLLQQAIDFICQNALEALQVRGDTLLVRTRPSTMPETGSAAILIEVLDNGPGVAEEILPQLYHPFVTSKTGGRGYGLGLAAASGIVQRHEGVIQLASKSGLGTAVQIFLPVPVMNKVAAEMEAAEEPAAEGVQQILLVDDEPFLLLIMKTALEQAGYKVHDAGTVPEALALFKKEKTKIKCAVIDIQLLDWSGTDLAKQILQLKPIPIIMTSGLQADSQAMAVIQASHGRFIRKPFGVSKLLEICKSVM